MQLPREEVVMRDGLGRSPFMVAVIANAVDMVTWLLEPGGACLDAKHIDDEQLSWRKGTTALHVLARVQVSC